VKTVSLTLTLSLMLAPAVMAQSDTQPPQLVGFSFAPSSVDVTGAPATITFSIHATDNLSGISSAQVQLRSPSGIQVPFGNGFPPFTPLPLDATFNVPVQILQYGEPGTWTVSSLSLRDRVSNLLFMNTAALAAAGFPTTFTVTDANPDTAAPAISSITMSPSTIDVSAGPQTITVDVNFTDALSGFKNPTSNVSFGFRLSSPTLRQHLLRSTAQWVLVSGTVNNGVWRVQLPVPRYAEAGVWRVTQMFSYDAAGNQRFFSDVDLGSFGASRELSVASVPSDTTPPQLTGLVFTPAFINTSAAAQNVSTDISMTDDLSGAAFVPDTPDISNLKGLIFRSPSGAQSRFTNSTFTSAPPVSGTPLNGVWRFDTFFPQFSEEGTYQVTAQLFDLAGNRLNLTTAQIAALGIPSTIDVIRPSLEPDGTITAAGGTVTDNTFGDRAQIIVPPDVFTQPTAIAIDVIQSPLNVPLPTGFSSAETYFVNIQLTPTPTFPLPPPGITVVLPLRNYTIPGTGINLLRINPVTGVLEPARDVFDNPVVGIVDPGGLTATFTGVARFSTVLGALPTAVPVEVDIKPGETPNTLNLKSNGVIPVAVFSTPTLDLTRIDPATIRFSGAPVSKNKQGHWLVSYGDFNGDGFDDLIAHFETRDVLLGTADVSGIVEGETLDGRLFRGTDSVRVIK
jgi:hypothetical protein